MTHECKFSKQQDTSSFHSARGLSIRLSDFEMRSESCLNLAVQKLGQFSGTPIDIIIYTTFIMADAAIVLDRVAWKRGQKGQKTTSCLFLYTMASASIFLTENDIPSVSLLGKNPRN